MENLLSIWAGLDIRRRVILALATIGVFVAVLVLSRSATSPDMALLYAGLDGPAAGEVLAALDQQGATYEVRNDAIYVPTAQRDILRMTLATEGLPATGGVGYELLDSMTGFGTTAQMFDAAYWRAKEGELARTILAVPSIRTARVHISVPTNRPFQREDKPTAAVTVSTGGAALSRAQVEALRNLVAASVSGLLPADVAIIDTQNGLIPLSGADSLQPASDQVAALQLRAERILEARVGQGNAVVALSIDTETDSESIVERRFNPEERVAISTEVEESTNSSTDSAEGDVTVASNLPDGDAANAGGGSVSEETSTRSVSNFEVSETNREVIRAPGAVRRLTVAILVNDVTTVDADGVATTAPRSEDELTALRDLVSSAVGLDEERGDIITIKSMPFEPVPELGTEAAPAGVPLDIMSLAKLGILALVAIILGLFVVRPILRSSQARPLLANPSLSGPGMQGLPAIAAPDRAEILDAVPVEAEPADPVNRLRRLMEERQDETARILQSWIQDDPAKERA